MEGTPLPPLTEGESLQLQEVELHQGKTSAPDYLSESELIGLMEKHGIGTDASISVHINNICERNYVSIQAGRKVVPTELGITLVRGYQLIDPELCRAQVCSSGIRAWLSVWKALYSRGVEDSPPPNFHTPLDWYYITSQLQES